jgi:copper(I)-binding protein
VAATALFTVSNAWAFPALKGGTGGAYFTLQNNTHHTARIVGASSPISAAAELHETMQTHAMSHMQMQRFVEIAPGQRIVFAPGGLHVMLARLNTAMVPNDTVRVVLDVTMVPAAHTTKNAITRVPISVVVRRP